MKLIDEVRLFFSLLVILKNIMDQNKMANSQGENCLYHLTIKL